MYCKLAFATLVVFVGYDFVRAQEQIPSSTTAAELWNPWTWFWPYAKAAAEGYRDYYEKAQKATNELYQQIYKTNAFPWVTGNWGLPSQNNGGNGGQPNQENQGGNGGQPNQENQGGNGGQPNQENQGGNGGQPTQENSTQSDQGNSDDQEKGTTEAQESQTEAGSGTAAQVQGNVQDDGTADAGANANVEGEEVQV